ncbi:MATE family efflux transporter [Psychromonas aquimarina]|uniref:MATE family efflux transporter n=1 Tax=Psychromonas aquimarina TaxID=444919 RepID=UPI0004105F97|nr:MATE family efflux transporter [Psychromonas aquimarina]
MEIIAAQNNKTLTTSDKAITRLFWRYAVPSVAAMLVNGLYQIIDGIFVGHYVGYQGLAAINMAWPIVFVVSGLGLMVGMGGGTLISIKRGQGDNNSGSQALTAAFILMFLLGIISYTVLSLFGASLLQVQGAVDITFELGLQYVTVLAQYSLITIGASSLPMLIRNDQSPNIATGLLVSGAVINIVLDYLFIGVLDWQLQGAAAATVAAQLIVCIGALIYFCSSRSALRVRRGGLKFNPKLIWRIITLGASCLVMYLYTSFIVALHNRLFMHYGTPLTVGAFAIVGYLMTLYYLLAEGLAEGMQPPVSYYHGAEQYQNIKRIVLLAVKVVVASGLVWLLVLNLFPDVLISLFNKSNAALTNETITGIRLHLFAMCLDGFIVLASVYFMAVGKGVKALTISVSNMLIQLPFLYFLPQWLGVSGVWLALPLSNIALFIIVAPLVWQDVHKRRRPMEAAAGCS